MQDLETRTENLARNEVLGNQSALVETLLKSDPRMIDELVNMHESYEQAAENEGWELYDSSDEKAIFYNPNYKEYRAVNVPPHGDKWAELCDEEGIDPEPQEVMEWWWVGRSGSLLAQNLEDVGAVLVAHPDTDDIWWGRTETGQGLALDKDLRAVVRMLEAKVA